MLLMRLYDYINTKYHVAEVSCKYIALVELNEATDHKSECTCDSMIAIHIQRAHNLHIALQWQAITSFHIVLLECLHFWLPYCYLMTKIFQLLQQICIFMTSTKFKSRFMPLQTSHQNFLSKLHQMWYVGVMTMTIHHFRGYLLWGHVTHTPHSCNAGHSNLEAVPCVAPVLLPLSKLWTHGECSAWNKEKDSAFKGKENMTSSWATCQRLEQLPWKRIRLSRRNDIPPWRHRYPHYEGR